MSNPPTLIYAFGKLFRATIIYAYVCQGKSYGSAGSGSSLILKYSIKSEPQMVASGRFNGDFDDP